MDSKLLPFFMMMSTAAENRNDVTQAIVSSMLPLGKTQRTMFSAINANNVANQHKQEVQEAERTASVEVAAFVGELANPDKPVEEIVSRYPLVTRYAISDKIVDAVRPVRALGKSSNDSTRDDPVFSELTRALKHTYTKSNSNITKPEQEQFPTLKRVFECDADIEKAFEKFIRGYKSTLEKLRKEEKTVQVKKDTKVETA